LPVTAPAISLIFDYGGSEFAATLAIAAAYLTGELAV